VRRAHAPPGRESASSVVRELPGRNVGSGASSVRRAKGLSDLDSRLRTRAKATNGRRTELNPKRKKIGADCLPVARGRLAAASSNLNFSLAKLVLDFRQRLPSRALTASVSAILKNSGGQFQLRHKAFHRSARRPNCRSGPTKNGKLSPRSPCEIAAGPRGQKPPDTDRAGPHRPVRGGTSPAVGIGESAAKCTPSLRQISLPVFSVRHAENRGRARGVFWSPRGAKKGAR